MNGRNKIKTNSDLEATSPLRRLLVIIVLLLVLIGGYLSCNVAKIRKTAEMEQAVLGHAVVGSGIQETRDLLVENGFSVSEIVDPTGLGKILTMSVRLKTTSFLDTIGYTIEIDLEPWNKNLKSNVIIEADSSGIISKVEAP